MTILLRWWRRWKPATPPDPVFAYRVAWTKEARTWDTERRAAIAEELTQVFRQSDFLPNTYDRRFQIPGLDDVRHSGASLVALGEVLEALELHSE